MQFSKFASIIQVVPALLLVGGLAQMAQAKDEQKDVAKRLEAARVVLNEIMDAGDKSIPRDLIEKAHCIAVIPGLKKAGFLVGAQYGKGFLTCRRQESAHGGWTGPASIRIEGGSFGLQIGGGEVDVVMLVMNESGAKKMASNEFKIGGEAGAMAGPVGRSVSAETDAYLRAEILSYSRSRGAFAGIALEGSTIRDDKDDNEALYGKRMSNEQILFTDQVRPPAEAKPFTDYLRSISNWQK